MSNMNRTMREAMRLMQAGDLHAATQAIQRGLRGGAEPAYAATAPAEASPSARCIEGQYRVVADSPSEAVQRPAITERTEHLRSNRRDGEFRHICHEEFPGARHLRHFRRDNREAIRICLMSALGFLAQQKLEAGIVAEVNEADVAEETNRRIILAMFIDSMMEEGA